MIKSPTYQDQLGTQYP